MSSRRELEIVGSIEPRASHLSMLEAIGGRDTIEEASSVALERERLWPEFGICIDRVSELHPQHTRERSPSREACVRKRTYH